MSRPANRPISAPIAAPSRPICASATTATWCASSARPSTAWRAGPRRACRCAWRAAASTAASSGTRRRGTRRRPVRVEFCDADVLDVFDEWRRAVGVPAAASEDGRGRGARPASRVARGASRSRRCPADRLRGSGATRARRRRRSAGRGARRRAADGKGLRGDARRQLLERLRALDAALVAAVARTSTPALATPRGRGRQRAQGVSRPDAGGGVRGRARRLRRSPDSRSLLAAGHRARMSTTQRGRGSSDPIGHGARCLGVLSPASSC